MLLFLSECLDLKKYVDAVSPALDRQSVLEMYIPCPDFKTPISDDCFHVSWSRFPV